MNELQFYWIDAFTAEKFSGNPAVVVISETPLSASLMQSYASEFNVSETAFVWPLDKNNHKNSQTDKNLFSLRWFTPVAEIGLCGHATLASTYAVCDFYGLTQVIFSTLSGEIKACRAGGDFEVEIEMPRLDVLQIDKTSHEYDLIASALNIDIISIHKSKTNFLVELATEASVKSAHPDMTALKTLECTGVIITAKSEAKNYDFVSRYFAPKIGIDEDPVTGSAHCSLAPFWFEKLDESIMTGLQISQRGGEIAVNLLSDFVLMKGKCITLFTGTNQHELKKGGR